MCQCTDGLSATGAQNDLRAAEVSAPNKTRTQVDFFHTILYLIRLDPPPSHTTPSQLLIFFLKQLSESSPQTVEHLLEVSEDTAAAGIGRHCGNSGT